jgi:hypothetical protein
MLHYAAKRLVFYLGLYVMQNKRLFFLLPHLSEMPGTARTLYRVTAMPQPFLERIFEKICAVSRQEKST